MANLSFLAHGMTKILFREPLRHIYCSTLLTPNAFLGSGWRLDKMPQPFWSDLGKMPWWVMCVDLTRSDGAKTFHIAPDRGKDKIGSVANTLRRSRLPGSASGVEQ
jgi:hypothetical protein